MRIQWRVPQQEKRLVRVNIIHAGKLGMIVMEIPASSCRSMDHVHPADQFRECREITHRIQVDAIADDLEELSADRSRVLEKETFHRAITDRHGVLPVNRAARVEIHEEVVPCFLVRYHGSRLDIFGGGWNLTIPPESPRLSSRG